MLHKPERLFARFREHGDARALARVFDLTAPKLLAVARHLALDVAAAEDLVQATFVCAIERSSSWNPKRALMPWLVGILGRQAANARRRAARDTNPEAWARPDVDRAEPGAELEQQELSNAVDAAMGDLPPIYRPVLSLYLSNEEQPEEIARRLGRAPGTVRVQIHRGLKLLRRSLPPGLATAAVAAVAPRGLAAVKAQVVGQAWKAAAGGATAVAPQTSGLLGGTLIMSKNATLAVLATVLLGGTGWFLLHQKGERDRARVAPEETRVDEVLSPPSAQGGPAARTVLPAEESAVEELPVAEDSSAGRQPIAVEEGTGDSIFDLTGRVRSASAGEWVEGADVTVYAKDAEGQWTPFPTRSGSDGRFRLSGVPLVPSAISVRKEGFAPTHNFRWSHEALASALAAQREFDLETIELQPGARVSGHVVDADGQSVPAASIYLVFHYFGNRRHGNAREPTGYVGTLARTDEQGRFELPDRLAFIGAGSYEQVLVAIAPDGMTGMGWTALELLRGRGDEEEVTIALQSGASLDLRVEDHNGNSLPGANVRMRARFEPFFGIGSFDGNFWHGDVASLDRVVAGVTSEAGRVRFEGLPLWQADKTRVSAEDAVYDANNPYEVTVTLPERSWTEGVHLAPGHNTHTLVVGQRPVRSIAGQVRDIEGEPIVGARVAVLDREAHSFTDGSFLVDGVVTGEISVEVLASAAGFADLRRNLVLGESTHVENVDLVLAAPAVVAGMVVDDGGHAISGSRLYLERPSDHGQSGTQFRALSAEDGSFSFPDASAGPWFLNAWPPGSVQDWKGVQTKQVLGGDEDVRIELARQPPGRARVVAHVIDASSRRPLDPTAVRLLPRFEFEPGANRPVPPSPLRIAGGATVDGVRPGSYRLWARTAEGEPAHVDFEVADTEREIELTIAVGGPSSLSGRVVLDKSIDPTHVRVSAQILNLQTSMPWGDEWKTDSVWRGLQGIEADGSFRFEGLIPGRYEIKMHHFAALAEETVELEADGEASVTLRPSPGAVWLFAGQAPAAEGFVFLEVEHAGSDWKSGTLWMKIENGRVQYRVLTPPGRVSWKARHNAENSVTALPEKTDQGQGSGRASSQSEVTIRLR